MNLNILLIHIALASSDLLFTTPGPEENSTLPVTDRFKLPEIVIPTVQTLAKNDRLWPLYKVANGFVYMVMKPFEEIEGFIEDLMVNPNSTWNYVHEHWQDVSIANYNQQD